MSLLSKTRPEGTGLLFSSRALFNITVPMILQQILNVTVGTVDSVMVAYTGEVAVSGVSLVNSLDAMLIIFFTSMVGGGSVVVAQTLGRKNEQEVRESVKQLIYCTTFFSLILSVTVLALRVQLLGLLFGGAEADVMSAALGYFVFVASSFPFLAINESIGASFRCSGNTMLSLIVSFAMNLINAGGNALFIIGLKMGAQGAGLATLISRVIGTVIMLILIHRKKYPVHVEKLLRYKPDLRIIGRILHIGIPNGIENTMFQFGRLMTQSLISTMGTPVIAANSVALTLANYQYMTGSACSVTMITVVGRCIGAGEERQAKYYSRRILLINYALMWTVCAGTVALIGPLMSLYNLSAQSTELAKTLVIVHCLFASVMWPLGFMLPSAFRAASDVRFTLVVSIVSMWVLRVAGAYLLAQDTVSVFGLFEIPGFGMGIAGVWAAMFADWVLRCSLYVTRFLSGRWLKILHKKN